jgi:hypothetical protein
MWVLWFVMSLGTITMHTPLSPPGDIPYYTSKTDCEDAGKEVLTYMNVSYPNDHTMRWYCTEVAWPIKQPES